MTGQTISHYRILDKLGEGGMGVVYKADDTKLRRIVALKFLRPEASADATFKERFLREAQAGGALDHPNICAVHGLEEADGHVFLVMSFIDGASLSKRLRAGGALPLDEAIEIVLSTAEGLRAAHRKGIVHRDVKSANIMTAEAGVVKITDFGLALLEDRSRLTRSGTLMGTVDYMAPEQVQALETLDRRADIWALGIVLYELVTGSLPFHRDNHHASLRAILLEPTPKLQSAVPGVPADLDWILGKMLAKSPAERYQHLDDFLVDLRRVRQGLSPAQAKLAAPRREIGPDDATQTELRSALAPPVRPGQRSFWIAAAVFAAVLIAAIAVWWRFFSS